jgi:hypothetical protein
MFIQRRLRGVGASTEGMIPGIRPLTEHKRIAFGLSVGHPLKRAIACSDQAQPNRPGQDRARAVSLGSPC